MSDRLSCPRCGFAVVVTSAHLASTLSEHLSDCPNRISKTELRAIREENKRDAFFASKVKA
jgi:hypothetical protein